MVESDLCLAVDPFVGLDCIAVDPPVGLDPVVPDNPSFAVESDRCLSVELAVGLDRVVVKSCVESSLKIMFLNSTIENMIHDKPVSVSVEVISVLVAVSSEKSRNQ